MYSRHSLHGMRQADNQLPSNTIETLKELEIHAPFNYNDKSRMQEIKQNKSNKSDTLSTK